MGPPPLRQIFSFWMIWYGMQRFLYRLHPAWCCSGRCRHARRYGRRGDCRFGDGTLHREPVGCPWVPPLSGSSRSVGASLFGRVGGGRRRARCPPRALGRRVGRRHRDRASERGSRRPERGRRAAAATLLYRSPVYDSTAACSPAPSPRNSSPMAPTDPRIPLNSMGRKIFVARPSAMSVRASR